VHNASVETAHERHGQVSVEIAYVVLSSALIVAIVVAVEWVAWWAFSLTGRTWRGVGETIIAVVLAALAVRAIRLLSRFDARNMSGRPAAGRCGQ
jgi:small neutral amino acid transporter SnatA (MarC family)